MLLPQTQGSVDMSQQTECRHDVLAEPLPLKILKRPIGVLNYIMEHRDNLLFLGFKRQR